MECPYHLLVVVFKPKLTVNLQQFCEVFLAPLKICSHRTPKWCMGKVCSHVQTHTHTSQNSPLPHTLDFISSWKLKIWCSVKFSIWKQKIVVNKSLLYAVKCWRISQLIAIMCILDQRSDGLYLEALQRVLHVMLATQLWLQALIQSQLQSNSQRSCLHNRKNCNCSLSQDYPW